MCDTMCKYADVLVSVAAAQTTKTGASMHSCIPHLHIK